MKKIAFDILRIGLAITFLWIGFLILKEPEAWGGYIQPWANNFLLLPLKMTMIGAAILNILVGFFLLINYFTWIAALIGSLHLIIILIVSGVNAITVRDIGLLGATISLFINSAPLYLQKFLTRDN